MNQHVGPGPEPGEDHGIEASARPVGNSLPPHDADRQKPSSESPSRREVVTRDEIEQAGGHIKLDLREGLEVVTFDGKELGRVSAQDGEHFKVDAPRAPDFWLPLDSVGSTVGGQVTLRFSEIDLADYKADQLDGAERGQDSS
jgi:hypothetical protein